MKTTEERFWSKIQKDGDCWIWIGAKSGPYGLFRYQGKEILAHVAARLILGLEVNEDHHHTCPNKLCVNPAHTVPMTKKEHGQLHYADKFGQYGYHLTLKEKTHCPHGHPLDGVVKSGVRPGKRYCKTCNRLRELRRRERAKECT